eukprot:4985609-Pyramimonas_sp.AAC.1
MAAQRAAVWGEDRFVLIASTDVKQTFQHLTVSKVAKAVGILEVPQYFQLAILFPIPNETSTLPFDAGMESVRVGRRNRAGGDDSLSCWNAVLVAMWPMLSR